MSTISGPKIARDSLIVNLDAANFKSSFDKTVTNILNPFTTSYARYNNPGFSGTITNTGKRFKGAPVFEATFIAQNASMIPRLQSGEGFGLLHNIITLQANTPYMSSIYFRTDYPLTSGFNNTYSNISGWGDLGTSTTRYEEDGWTRMYTRYFNSTIINGTAYSVIGTSNDLTLNVNTTVQTDILITCTFNSNGTLSCVGPLNTASYTLRQAGEMVGVYSMSPTISSTTVPGMSTGGSPIINHGLNTSTWTKLTTTNNVLRSSFPISYFFSIRVPSTSGINRAIVFRPTPSTFNTGLGDSKYWKITFNTANLQVGEVIRTYWAAPMLEQTNRPFPSRYVIGSKSTSRSNNADWADTSGKNNHASLVNSLTYNFLDGGSFLFDGVDDSSTLNFSRNATSSYEVFASATTIPASGIMLFNTGASGVGPTLYFNSGKITWNIWDGNANPFGDIPSNALDGKIHHYVVVCESGVNCRLFYDGALLGTAIYRNPAANTLLTIGASVQGGLYFWPGRIAKFRVYNKALTATEIKQNFEAHRKKYRI